MTLSKNTMVVPADKSRRFAPTRAIINSLQTIGWFCSYSILTFFIGYPMHYRKQGFRPLSMLLHVHQTEMNYKVKKYFIRSGDRIYFMAL